MNKRYYTTLVLLMSFSLIGIILMQGYWIYSSWQNKEEEFTLAVNRTLRQVVNEIQSRELNDYVYTYQMLIDSIGSPDESNFTDVFLFLDEDQSSNLSTFFAYGILEEDYNINLPNNLSNIKWSEEGEKFKNLILDKMDKSVLPGIKQNVVSDFYLTPDYFEKDLATLHGSGFSIQPKFSQSAYFRFHNQSEVFSNLYFVGAGTHPGAGMPGVLSSAKVLDRLF